MAAEGQPRAADPATPGGGASCLRKLGASALVATQHDNVQYVADVRRFFVYGWEPNSLALISKEGAVRSLDCGLHVAPGPHWANDGAALKSRRAGTTTPSSTRASSTSTTRPGCATR